MPITKFLCWFVVLLAMSAGQIAHAQKVPDPPALVPLRQVVLIQNSGWMEPFYTTENLPEFKRRLARFVEAIADRSGGGPANDRIILASFNQERRADGRQFIPGRTSPYVLGSGDGSAGMVEMALQRLDLATAPTGNGSDNFPRLADSDFDEALRRAKEMLEGKPGLIWLITNNLPAPKNDVNVGLYNQQLHDMIRDDVNGFVGVQVNPVAWEVRGHRYYRDKPAPGFMVYAFAIDTQIIARESQGSMAEAYLRNRVELARNPLGGQFGRLKPIKREPFELRIELIQSERSVKPAWDPDGYRTLVLDKLNRDQKLDITLKGNLTSIYYAWKIENAQLSAFWVPISKDGCARDALKVDATFSFYGREVQSIPIHDVEPRADVAFEAHLQGPSPKDLSYAFPEGSVSCEGFIVAAISRSQLSQMPEFRARIENFFYKAGTDAAAIPDSYLPLGSPGDSVAAIQLRLVYPPSLPLGAVFIVASIIGGLAGVMAIAYALHVATAKTYPVRVDGRMRYVPLKLGARREFPQLNGDRVVAKRGWFGGFTTDKLPNRSKQGSPRR